MCFFFSINCICQVYSAAIKEALGTAKKIGGKGLEGCK